MHVLNVIKSDPNKLLLWLLLDVTRAEPRNRRLPLNATRSIADIARFDTSLAVRLF